MDPVATYATLVRRLLRAQFPHWAELPIEPVRSAGTDNAIYRLGDELAVRLPRIHWAVGHVEKEQRWLPRLARTCRFASPSRWRRGRPARDIPGPGP